MRYNPSPLDAACPTCTAPRGVACHPVGPDGVHTPDVGFAVSVSHPSRFHAAGMFCADTCEGCPLTTCDISHVHIDEDDE